MYVHSLPIFSCPTLGLRCCLKISSLKHEDFLLVLSFTTLIIDFPYGGQTYSKSTEAEHFLTRCTLCLSEAHELSRGIYAGPQQVPSKYIHPSMILSSSLMEGHQ